MLYYLNIKYFDNKNCHNSIHKQTKFIHVSNGNSPEAYMQFCSKT